MPTPDQPFMDAKVYAAEPGNALSVRDLLDHFGKLGTLRVTDLHLKAGSPPAYRVDGELQRTKGAPLDAPTVAALARTLLTPEKWAALDAQRSVDSSLMLVHQSKISVEDAIRWCNDPRSMAGELQNTGG